jgi:hypothetical protein
MPFTVFTNIAEIDTELWKCINRKQTLSLHIYCHVCVCVTIDGFWIDDSI